MSKLDVVKNALLTVMDNVGHYKALKEEPPYAVWAEDDAIGFRSDNRTDDQALTGTIDLFTKQENDPRFAMIQGALNDAGIAWGLNSIQYEDDTGYIHYEWVWSVG